MRSKLWVFGAASESEYVSWTEEIIELLSYLYTVGEIKTDIRRREYPQRGGWKNKRQRPQFEVPM